MPDPRVIEEEIEEAEIRNRELNEDIEGIEDEAEETRLEAERAEIEAERVRTR